jgi:hypothetical protein
LVVVQHELSCVDLLELHELGVVTDPTVGEYDDIHGRHGSSLISCLNPI